MAIPSIKSKCRIHNFKNSILILQSQNVNFKRIIFKIPNLPTGHPICMVETEEILLTHLQQLRTFYIPVMLSDILYSDMISD